jgi:hypothetical protein
MNLTDAGMAIDVKYGQEQNARSPSIETLETRSKVTLESAPHLAKQSVAIVWTDDGMQIEISEPHFAKAESFNTWT